MELLNGRLVQSEMIKLLKEKLSKLDRKLKLVIIEIGDNKASNIYLKQKKIVAFMLGIDVEIFSLDADIGESEIFELIDRLNDDVLVDGIMIQLPISDNLDSYAIRNRISPLKDVDGLNFVNLGKLIQGCDCLVPSTALGIMDLLSYYNIEISGKNVVIINRSDIIGKPLAHLFMNRNATVTVCHSKTDNLDSFTKCADILVVGVGISNFITADMVREGSVIVDVGINYVNGKVVGDVDFENVKDKVSYITPTPGGVGPMTVIELMNNLYKIYNMNK